MRQAPGSRRLLLIAAVFGAVGGAQMIGGSSAERQGELYDDPPAPLVDPAGALTDQPLPGGVQLLRGVLADPDGRRELRFVDPVTGADEVIAEAGWNLPPDGAPSGDQLLVCFNVVQAAEPGVRLVCRRRAANGVWDEPLNASGADASGWLKGVSATAQGWTVRYLRESEGTSGTVDSVRVDRR